MKQNGWHKWTNEEHKFLVKHFRLNGDTKLAQMFNDKFPKGYLWTKKHIEKRRNYFGLKRTKKEENRLRVLNNGDGRHYKAWDTRGRMKDGEVRDWDGRKYIKVDGVVKLYYRHLAGAGEGDVVRVYEGGIKIITKKENQLLNAKIRADRPMELKETIKALNKLKNLLNEQENSRPTGYTF